MKNIIILIAVIGLILTACQPQEQTLIRRTTINNIEDMCPNENSTFCYYYVTDTVINNITYNVTDGTNWTEYL